ncbi:hypothetical protein NDA10_004052 [Ustilago hordei]|nr:hypothetical protein NDA10_004052 [Ustilago hordei]UTT95076.1 hypothetical protein NDA17_001540 [Ustilago hordei]
MFYSSDILSRRKTGLGIVWLAATLGDRSVVRRLTRKEILSVNITLTCEHLQHPSEPFALRLSSQLLFGVVKLYSHQTELLLSDASNAHSDVRRRMFTTSTISPTTREIDMRTATKQVEAITLPLDLAFFTLDFDQLGSGMLYRWSVEPPERRVMEEDGLEDAFRTPTPTRHLAPEERTTLLERAFQEDDLGLARAYEEGEGIGAPGFEGYEEDEFEGLDLGLEPPTRPEPIEPGILEGIERRFEGDETALTEHIVEWPELEERLAEEAARMGIGPVTEGVPTVTPLRRPRAEEEQVQPPLAPALRPRPPPVLLEDRPTELSEAQRRAAEANYPERMAAERAALRRRTAARKAAVTARRMMFAPPSDLCLHPELSELWESTVTSHLSARGARFRALRDEANLLPLDGAPPSPPPPTPEEEEVEELGVARAAVPEIPAALRGARESLPWNIFAEHRRRSSMMPSISYDREITPLRIPREISVETPTGLRRIPPESPLFIPPTSPSTVAPLEEYPMPETPSVERFRLGLPTAPAERVGERELTPPSQVFEEDMEEETRNFLEYARSIREELEDPSIMFFSDLAPVASSTPAVAAQAFYHTLVLASGGRVKVKQEGAYQEIRVTVL